LLIIIVKEYKANPLNRLVRISLEINYNVLINRIMIIVKREYIIFYKTKRNIFS